MLILIIYINLFCHFLYELIFNKLKLILVSLFTFYSSPDEVDALGYGSSTSSSPPSDLDESWLSFRAAAEPSLTAGEIICSSFTDASTKKHPPAAARGVSCDRYRGVSGNNRRTISGSSSSSDGGMASFAKRLTINEGGPSLSSLPKINVMSSSHKIRINNPL